MRKTYLNKFISLKQYDRFVKKRKLCVLLDGKVLVLRIKDKDFKIAKKIDKLKAQIRELRKEVK